MTAPIHIYWIPEDLELKGPMTIDNSRLNLVIGGNVKVASDLTMKVNNLVVLKNLHVGGKLNIDLSGKLINVGNIKAKKRKINVKIHEGHYLKLTKQLKKQGVECYPKEGNVGPIVNQKFVHKRWKIRNSK